MRSVVAALIVVGLAAGIWLLWPDGGDISPGSTFAAPSTTTSTRLTSTASSTVPPPTSTTTSDSRVVATVEEAEEILRELWFGWFEGIYNQDEERIREVVASSHQLGLAKDQFERMQFDRAPTENDLRFAGTELLLTTSECTVVLSTGTFSGFMDATTTDVHVLRWADGWAIFSLWAFPDDLWEGDCAASLD